MNDDAERISELEIRLSFQDELLDVLNQTVITQHARIELLERQFNLLVQQYRSMAGTSPANNPEDDIPPHY